MADKIQIRRGTAAGATTANVVLAEGEIGYETDTFRTKVGDGVTAWTALAYVNVPPTSGAAAPATTPVAIGQLYIETTTPAMYFAKGVASSADWQLVTAGGGGGVTDHGALNGLTDDDHAQYHNDTRGDARYYTQSAADAAFDAAGSATAAQAAAEATAAAALSGHEADTTAVHGIADTSALVATTDTSLSGASFFDDDDTMAANSAQVVASQQAIVAYVASQIAAVIASAPGALDTLNELAASLGDDDDFAGTMTTALAAKAAITDTVLKALYDANTIVAADTDNTPTARTVAEDRIVGRASGGQIAGLTAAQVRTLIDFVTQVQAVELSDMTAPTATVDINGQELDNVESVRHDVNTVAATGATETLLRGWNDFTMDTNCTISAPASPADGDSFYLRLRQDGTGGRVATLPAGEWHGGTAPTLTTTASGVDLLGGQYDGTAWHFQAISIGSA